MSNIKYKTNRKLTIENSSLIGFSSIVDILVVNEEFFILFIFPIYLKPPAPDHSTQFNSCDPTGRKMVASSNQEHNLTKVWRLCQP